MPTALETMKRLADEQKRAWEAEGKPLADIAAERALTAEEREKFDRLNGDFDAYDERLLALRHQADVEARAIEFADNFGGAAREMGHDETLASEFRKVLAEGGFRDMVPTAAEVRAISRQLPTDLPASVAAALRSLSVGSATAGGNTVGKTFLTELIEPLRQFSGIEAAGAFKFVTSGGEEVIMPRLTSFGTAAAQSEQTSFSGSTDPAFGTVSYKSYKYGSYLPVSNELIEDSLFDIDGLVTRLAGENVSILLGQKLALGAGTTEPMGAATAATVGVTGAAGVAGVPTWDNLIDLQESLLAPYQANAAWVLSNGALGGIRKLKDSSGRYLWEPNGQAGGPAVLMGNPVFRDPFIATPAAGARSILFGDFSRYWIRIVGSVRVERSDHALFSSDSAAFRAVLRADANLADSSAIKAFVGGAAS